MLNIDLHLLLVFLQVYETSSLSKTARHLKMSQPGVSLALKRLRDHFADPLFVRTPKGMAPTVLAQALHPSFHRSAQDLQASLSFKLNFEPMKSERVFRVAMSDFGQLIWLPHILEHLCQEAPGISLEISSIAQNIERELSGGIVDLALGITFQVNNDLYQQHLVSWSFTGLISKEHPFTGEEMTLQEYEDAKHLTVSSGSTGFNLVNKHLETLGIRRKVATNLSSFTGIAAILMRTNYLMTTPVQVADMVMRHGYLKKVRLPFDIPPMNFMQHWHARQKNDPGNRWLRTLIASLQTSDDVGADLRFSKFQTPLNLPGPPDRVGGEP